MCQLIISRSARYYSCHYLDYQTFAFELLVRNDVKGLEFQCPLDAGSCLCPMPSTLPAEQCALAGNDIVVVRYSSNRKMYIY